MKNDSVMKGGIMVSAVGSLPALIPDLIRTGLVMIFILLIVTLPLPSQADEIAVSVGQRYGGSFEDTYTATQFDVENASSYSVVLDFDSALQEQIEVYLSRQDTRLTAAGLFTGNPLFDLTIDYYHVGGLVLYGQGDGMRPFISGTFGMTQMSPKRADLSTENKPSISLGGGGKVFLGKQIGLRFEVRGIYTALDANSDIFCAGGGCSIKVRSSGFIQIEFSTSLIARF
jgi:hypothetical protein